MTAMPYDAELDADYTTWQLEPLGEEKRAELTRSVAARLLAAPIGTRVLGQYVAGGGWPKGADERPGVAEARGDYEAVLAALGPREYVVLTTDRRAVNAGAWCTCRAPRAQIYYERWTAAGRVAHGYVHAAPACRRLVQTG